MGRGKSRRQVGSCDASTHDKLSPQLVADIELMLDISQEEYDQYNSMSPYRATDSNGQTFDIPASYIRERGARKFVSLWSDSAKATHNVIFRNIVAAEGRCSLEEYMYPMHDMVLLSQCAFWELALVKYEAPCSPDVLPPLVLQVPHPENVELILEYLHFHGERKLYQELSAILSTQPERFLCIARNVRSLGILDPKLISILCRTWDAARTDYDRIL